MKKMFLGALVALGMLTACDGGPTGKIETELDSLCYTFGMTQSRGLAQYMQGNGLDSAYIDEFLKGVCEAQHSNKDPKKLAYLMGLQIGLQINNGVLPSLNHELYGEDSENTVNTKAFYAGFCAGAKYDTSVINMNDAVAYAEDHLQKLKDKFVDEKFGDVRKASEEFIAKKAKEEGVKELDKGVYYKVLNEGTGAVPSDTDRVKIKYEGRLVNGNVFDSNYEGEPAELDLKQTMTIPGFLTALKAMPAGSEWEIYLSYEQAYGTQNAGAIPPCSALIFKVRLVEIIK